MKRNILFVILFSMWLGAASAWGEEASPDYLAVVRGYADAMIERGRDRYGEQHTPLFAVTLDRRTLSLPTDAERERLLAIPRSEWGVRRDDRVVTGANPFQDADLYQTLYALSEVTGDERYRREADAALRWFFEHAQSKETGLLAWGEHMGWDFLTDTYTRNKPIHEFAGPWPLWDHTFELAPDAAARFAKGLWEHQIHDHQTGDFSRHADFEHHHTGDDSQYPRHGGFYIATWAHAYRHTRDPVYLTAIRTLMDSFNRRRNATTGAIPAETHARSGGRLVWPTSNLSLAIDLTASAPLVPDDLAQQMRATAGRTDEIFLKLGHDLAGKGGFVSAADADTLQPGDVRKPDKQAYTTVWAVAYGAPNTTAPALTVVERYRQTKDERYRKLAVAAAELYLDAEPDESQVLHPRVLANLIGLLIDVYQITGERRFLDRADHFGRRAVTLYPPDDSPLPRATNRHNHYEAITGGPTLMMALLDLYDARRERPLELELEYGSR